MEWFGKKAEDKITGFVGTAIGYCQYNTGCCQILLAPKVAEDGAARESSWFDEQRVVFLDDKPIKLNNGITPGCDRPAPIK